MSLLSAVAVSHNYPGPGMSGHRQARDVLERVSFALEPNESVALVGRSGCGKSTLARLLVGLETPTSGHIHFDGKPVVGLRRAERLALWRTVQLVFQDPVSAVNPRTRVGDIVAEPLRGLYGMRGSAVHERVATLLQNVHLHPDDAARRPQTLSGGQLQRVCLARALAAQPRLIILDEAVSSLDLPLQAEMLDLLVGLQRREGVSYLLVTHDLRLVERFCSRVLVVAHGQIVEDTPVSYPLSLQSDEGRALARAVLPPFPQAGGFMRATPTVSAA